MMILCLETSSKVCSVALEENGKLITLKESYDELYSHSENLMPYIDETCKQANTRLPDIDAIAVSKGPGSFTGLRIGVSAAKGLCYALDKPLIAVNTLQAMAIGLIQKIRNSPDSKRDEIQNLFCPMIDARRMEVYYTVYNEKLDEIEKISAEIIDENSFKKLLLKNKIYFFGDGAEKCRSKIIHPHAIFIDNIHPSAKFMIPLAEKYFSKAKFEDVAYFEPFYLKDFFGSKSIINAIP